MTNFNSHGVANHHASNRNLGISSNRLSQEQNSLLRANNTKLDTIDGVLDNIKLDTTAIKTSVELLDNAVDGNELQVDVVSSSLPSGAATEATLSALNTKVTACDTGAVVVSSSALPSGAATESTLAATESGVAALDTRLATTNSTLTTIDSVLDTIKVDTEAIETAVEAIQEAVKEEDAAHSSGDKGFMFLGVRQSVQADFGADGDYVPISINDDGEIRVTTGSGGGGGDASAANQTTMIGHLSEIEGAVETIEGCVSGTEVQVDIVSSALPSGAATAANQSTANTSLATIAGDTTSLDGKVTACNTGAVVISSSALPSGASTSALQGGGLPAALTASGNLKVSVEEGAGGDASAANQTTMIGSLSTIAGDTTSLDSKVTACNTGAVVVSSSALPTGAALESTLSALNTKVTACDTGSVVVTSNALPTGASTAANQATANGSLATIAGDTTSIDGKITACNTGAVVVSSSALPSGAASESTLSTLNTKVLQGYDATIASGGTGLIQVLTYGRDSSGNLDALNVDNNGHLKVISAVVENKGSFGNLQNGTLNFGSTSSVVDVSDYNHAVFLYEDTNTSTFDDPVFEISMDNSNFYKASDQLFTSVRGSKREGTKEMKLHGITHVRFKNESTADNFTNCKATIVGTPN